MQALGPNDVVGLGARRNRSRKRHRESDQDGETSPSLHLFRQLERIEICGQSLASKLSPARGTSEAPGKETVSEPVQLAGSPVGSRKSAVPTNGAGGCTAPRAVPVLEKVLSGPGVLALRSMFIPSIFSLSEAWKKGLLTNSSCEAEKETVRPSSLLSAASTL